MEAHLIQNKPHKTARARHYWALTVAIVAISIDFLLIHYRFTFFHFYRIVFTALAVCLLARVIYKGQNKSTGLTLHFNKGLRYWLKATLIFAFCDAGLMAIFFLATLKSNGDYSGMDPADLYKTIPKFCLYHSLQEELLYRLILCIPFLRLTGRWWTIIASGFLFAVLHIFYGAGVMLVLQCFVIGGLFAWAFISSGSILVTLAWHSLSNLYAIGFSVLRWYLIN